MPGLTYGGQCSFYNGLWPHFFLTDHESPLNMKLAAKLILLFLVGVLGIVVLFSWQIIQRQNQWEQQFQEKHAKDLVETLDPAITNAFRTGGNVTVREVVQISTQRLSGAQLRWIDGSDGAGSRVVSSRFSRISISSDDGSRIGYSYVPITVDGKDAGAVEVAMPMNPLDSHVRDSLYASVISLFGVAVLSASVIFVGGIQLVGKPLRKLIDQVKTIGEGNFAQPPALMSTDELGRLASAISQMSYRLGEQRDTIRHTDRLGTIGTLAAGVAHELGTPLNVVSGRAGLIATGKLSVEEVEASARTIKFEAERMTTIIRQLLDFARQTPTPHDLIEARAVMLRTCEMMRPMTKDANVELVQLIPDDSFSMDGDAAQIQQVITNLIRNAIQAMPKGGTLTAKMQRVETGNIGIEITDTGVGMKQQDVDRVFEPFYTTKDVGQGTGLGLSIAYGIVREHGGEIKVASQIGKGTTFSVIFPAATAVGESANEASI